VYPTEGGRDLRTHSFCGDDDALCRDYARALVGLPAWRPGAKAHGSLPARGQFVPAAPGAARGKPAATDEERTARAMALWDQAKDPAGTPVELYLERRGLSLPPDAGSVIRYHPHCPFGGVRTRCMVALVRSIPADRPQAIHRTTMSETGEKAFVGGHDRLALGPVGGGAIKLWNDAEVSISLGVGEGIETTLSLRLHPDFAATPVWSLIDAGHLEAFPVLAGLEGLIIAVDRDRSGRGDEAADALIDRYVGAGVEVTRARPRQLGDLNDLLREP
jgi:hypothetical protein